MPKTSVPKNRAEAEQLLADIGRAQRKVAEIERRMNERLATVKERFEKVAQPYNEELEAKFDALHAWAEANKDELLRNGGKTASLATGEVSWRTSPPSVRLSKAEVVLVTLKRLGLDRFIRTKEEVDKTAILGEPEAVRGIRGISITQKEEFVAKPFESRIERARTVKRAQKDAARRAS